MNLATQSALYIKKGNEMQRIEPAKIPALMEIVRAREMQDGRGGSDFKGLIIFNEYGKRIARVSWNGSIWPLCRKGIVV